MALSQEAIQSMLDAMNIISSAQMHNISYDETIVCTITDNSHAKQESYYTVTDGSVRFKAYVTSAEDTTKYKVDDQVYVKIPKGDYSQKKIIEGYYVTDAEVVPVTYVSPLDTFLDMANLIETDGTSTDVSGQLIANDTTTNQIALWQWSIDDSDGTSDDLQVNGIYDTLGLQASFKCLLDSYKMRKGTYGLRLDLYVRLNPTSDKHITKSIYLDSTEMFGNPYSFTIYATQAKTFDITKIGTIDGMTLWFYQNKDFVYFDGKNERSLPAAEVANIFVKDVYIAFGSELSKVEDNIIKLYTTEDQNFKYEQPGDATNQKHLGFLWYNKTEDSDYIGFSDGIVDLKRNENGEIISPEEIDHYDEIEYLKLSHEDSRLVEQMGKDVPDDENGLDISASVEEGKAVFDKLIRAVQVNLVNTLNDFYQRTKSLSLETDDGVISCNEYFNKVGENDIPIGKIKIAEAYGKTLEESYKKLFQWYNSALSAAAAIETHQKNKTTPTEKEEPDKVVRYNNNQWETVTSWVDKDGNPQTKFITTPGYAPILATLQPLLNNYYTYVEVEGEMQPEFILNELRTNISNKYNGFQDIYDTYSARLDTVLKDIQGYFEELNSILQYKNQDEEMVGKENLITSSNKEADKDSFNYQYTLNKTIITYTQRDFSHMANRYCVYWYRYVAGYKDEEGLIEDEWMRLKAGDEIKQTCNETGSKFTMPENLGLPLTWTEDGGTLYFSPKAGSGEGFASVYLDPGLKEEKFKVVLYYNHERFVSNELVFTNLDKDKIPDGATMDATDAIYIEHDSNSMESYQTLYASNYSLINKGHSSINRKLRLHYDGLFGGDEVLAGASVYWYLPRNATMLTANVNRLTSAEGDRKAFSTDYYRTAKVLKDTTARRGPSTEYQVAQIEIIKTETKEDGSKEEVKTKVDLAYKTGDIIQAVYSQTEGWYSLTASEAVGASGQWINGDDIEIIDNDEIFMDGYACFYKNIGFEKVTEAIEDEDGNVQYVEKDVIVEDDAIFEYRIKDYYEFSFLNNTIFCIVKKGEYKFETSISMIFGTQGTSGTDYTVMVRPSGDQKAVDNSNLLPLLVKAFNYDNEEIPIKTTSSELKDGSLYKPTIKWRGPSTANIAFLDNETGPEINSAEASVNANTYKAFSNPKGNNACGVAQISVTMYDSTYGGAKELSLLYPVAWTAGDYFIEGPTSIIYDSSGANPAYYKQAYRIFDGATNTELIGATWDIKYFMQASAGNLHNESIAPKYMFCWEIEESVKHLRTYDIGGNEPVLITEENNAALFKEVNFYASYVPQLNITNELTPCNTYISGEPDGNGYTDLNVYPVVQCFDKNGALIWAQPIVITQNRYPNSMINHWDGKFQIDEENGTILSTMVGAGYKNSDNTYSGVLMGKIDCDNEDNASDVGLYGFHHGAQSFGLNIDGTAFFGKSGRGRILFDGNSGTISSASYQENRDTENGSYKKTSAAGMMIDLDDGFIDMLGTTKTQNEDGSYTYTPEKLTGANDNEVAQAHIHIDVKSPYFTIRSSTQMDKDKHIIHIANDKYYLQSDNYVEANYSLKENITIDDEGYLCKVEKVATNKNNKPVYKYTYVSKTGANLSDGNGGTIYKIPAYTNSEDKEVAEVVNGDLTKRILGQGKGTFINLADGVLDAYNLYITSKNVFIDSRENADPYFVVRSDVGHNLLYVGSDNYYLKTDNYRAKSTDSEGNITYGLGTKINLNDGIIESYKFKLIADAENDHMHLNSAPSNSQYYFDIGNSTNYLKFKGDGTLSIASQNFDLTTSTIYISDTGKTFTINGTERSDIVLKMGTTFGVSSGGALYASNAVISGNITATTLTATTKGTIGGWTIGPTSLSSTGTTLHSTGQIETTSGDFGVSADGVLTASGANVSGTITAEKGTIGGWTIGGASETAGGTTLTSSGNTITLDSAGSITVKDVCTIDSEGIEILQGSITLGEVFSVTEEGELTAESGTIGGWTINESSLSGGAAADGSGGLILDGSAGTITAGNIQISSDGFYNVAKKAAFPSFADGIVLWTGWSAGKGYWTLYFNNGLLSEASPTFGADATTSGVLYEASVSSTFKKGDDSLWTCTLDPASGDVGADGTINFSCALNPPTTLYTRSAATVTVQGEKDSYSTRYYYYDGSKVTYGSYEDAKNYPYTSVSGYFTTYNRYKSGTTYYSTYYTTTEYCSSTSGISGGIKVILLDG